MGFKKVVDLSQKLIPGKERFHLDVKTKNMAKEHPEYKTDEDIWYIISDIDMSSHCGTHIEVPYHHNENGLDCSDFPLDRLICKGVLVDFSTKKTNEKITLEELKEFEDKINDGEVVIFNFGCAKNYRTERMHDRPYLEEEAVKWLADVKKVNIIGTDATGIEVRGEGGKNQPNHQYLMDRGIPLIESMTNLENLAENFTLIILPLTIKGLDSCPVRVIAVYFGEES